MRWPGMPDSKRPGRPAIQEGVSSTPVSTRVPTPTYDEVVTLARDRRVDVAVVVREAVESFVLKNRPNQ